MRFTDRFIRVPVKIFSYKDESMGMEIYIDAVSKILPMEIAEYHAYTSDEGPATMVYMKSGRSFSAYLPEESFESLLNNKMEL